MSLFSKLFSPELVAEVEKTSATSSVEMFRDLPNIRRVLGEIYTTPDAKRIIRKSLEGPEVFGLPTGLELTAARGELSSRLRKQRKRNQTDFTGGLSGGVGLMPTLKTI